MMFRPFALEANLLNGGTRLNLPEKPYVVCVGAANVDLQGFSKNPIILHDSNPGHLEMSAGGVSRNIAENLARMGVRVALMTALGDDLYGEMIKKSCLAAGIDMSHATVLSGQRSSLYLSVTDTDGDMYVAISDMRILKALDGDFVRRGDALLRGAAMIVCDPSLSPAAMRTLVEEYGEVPVVVDTVSTSYARIVKEMVGLFHTVKPNRLEAEILSDIPITDDDSLHRAAQAIIGTGARRVFITLGKGGVYYLDREGNRMRRRTREQIHMVNATGAGDAMTAGIVYSTLHGFPLPDMLDFSMTAAIFAVSHENTINPDVSAEAINNAMKEWRL